MKNIIKQFRNSQKGFTLIELLVVVAILGVLAAVMVPAVSKFIGSGTVEAANTEAHNVQTAVVAWMADSGNITFGLAIGPDTDNGPEEFLVNHEALQATYQFTDGAISSANATSGGKWDGLTWASDTGWVKPE